jgi:hypothetical protein
VIKCIELIERAVCLGEAIEEDNLTKTYGCVKGGKEYVCSPLLGHFIRVVAFFEMKT